MEQYVFVRLESPGRYVAQSLAAPEVKAAADTEEAAVEKVGQALIERFAGGKVVRLELPFGKTGNPWLAFAGSAKDDPLDGLFQEELRRARELDKLQRLKELDEQP